MIDNNGYNVVISKNGKENSKDNGRGRTASFAGEDAKRRKGGGTEISNNTTIRLATGGGDALINMWDFGEMVSNQVISRLEHLVSNVSFSYCGGFIAAGGDDKMIDVGRVDGKYSHSSGGEKKSKLCTIDTGGKTESLAWHPSEHLLAFAIIPIKGKMKFDYNNRPIQEKIPTVRILVLEDGGKK